MRDPAIARSLGKVTIAAEGYLALSAVQLTSSNPSMTAALLLTNPVSPGASEQAEAPRNAALELDHLDDLCIRGSGRDGENERCDQGAFWVRAPVPVRVSR